ncbi:hypothetical protein CFP56_002215 [Quercus suber]|uniref:Uncharacterized protein n=1 Tax=Quercus suber TaxID=58331 RepID=A0AAW0MAW6_QUESU
MFNHSAPEKEEVNLTAEYDLEVYVSDACSSCYSRGGICELDNKRKFHCAITEKAEGNREHPYCFPFQCGKFGNIGFPFTNIPPPFECDETPLTIKLPLGVGSGKPFEVINISYTNTTQSTRIRDLLLWEYLNTSKCEYLINFTVPNSPYYWMDGE